MAFVQSPCPDPVGSGFACAGHSAAWSCWLQNKPSDRPLLLCACWSAEASCLSGESSEAQFQVPLSRCPCRRHRRKAEHSSCTFTAAAGWEGGAALPALWPRVPTQPSWHQRWCGLRSYPSKERAKHIWLDGFSGPACWVGLSLLAGSAGLKQSGSRSLITGLRLRLMQIRDRTAITHLFQAAAPGRVLSGSTGITMSVPSSNLASELELAACN